MATSRLRAFAESGFSRVLPVPEQLAPDGEFPTVAFPNPEERGAMDLSLALARKASAELVVANDPDADRLAVAVPSSDAPGDGCNLQVIRWGRSSGITSSSGRAARGRPSRS
ncbi:MAG: hypothetical protein U0235_06105 [Polyangiaceae bacterium]